MMTDLKIGLVVRCDNRGLANQTLEVYRHVPYTKVLVIRDPGSERQGFKPHPERYPDGQVVFFDRYNRGHPTLPQREVRAFLEGLDVVYSAETYYDWRFCDWAKDMGVATVLHANPEFYFHWRDPSAQHPTSWWSATSWRQGNMPPDTRVIQMPVPLDRWPEPDFDHNPRQVLHIGGLEAVRDRNGTKLAVQAAEALKNIEVLINVQDKRNVKYVHQRNVDNYWEMYENDVPVMLIPRRYGGLCLPAIEAIGAGKLVMMSDVEPNRQWPIYPFPAHQEPKPLTTQGGDIPLFEADVSGMVNSIQHVFDSGELPKLRRQSYEWAKNNSWDKLLDVWLNEFRLAKEAVSG